MHYLKVLSNSYNIFYCDVIRDLNKYSSNDDLNKLVIFVVICIRIIVQKYFYYKEENIYYPFFLIYYVILSFLPLR